MITSTPYQPPKHLLEVLQKIAFDEALEPDDPRFVDTQAARGAERTQQILARKLGLDLTSGSFFFLMKNHVLFFGHTGSGKTTQLRAYKKALTSNRKLYVVEVDIRGLLDRNNLQYADTVMAMARTLVEHVAQDHIQVGAGAISPLEDWFNERVRTEVRAKEFVATLQAGAGGGGIPGLVALFAGFTAMFKSNTTYKDSIRTVVRNTFTQFAAAFNAFLRAVEKAIAVSGRGERVVFMIDGTDKINAGDRHRFFVEDAEQLLAIDSLVVYTAPLDMKYEGRLTNALDTDLVLPMIKLHEADNSPCPTGRQALRDILLRRADRSLFADDSVIDRLVEASGGHPRDLLRLLKLCCEIADDNRIDSPTVDRSINKLANQYRRFLEPDDYDALARLDRDGSYEVGVERIGHLLSNLAILGYNDGTWRRSHPVVRLLEGYRSAWERLAVPAQSS